MTDPVALRYEAACRIAEEAGALALSYFHRVAALDVELKGAQDFVTEADRGVEAAIRAALLAAFPEDGIVGEEDAPHPGVSGFTWVIDPIDGTTNFVHGSTDWVVVLACVRGPHVEIGVIRDAVHDETWRARRGGGAFCGDRPISVRHGRRLDHGSVGLGFSARAPKAGVLRLAESILNAGGVFHRNGSGALSLVYVACGKLIGYVEAHMNAWDCIAGQLLVAEAGGVIEEQDAQAMIREGGRVIAATPEAFADLAAAADAAWRS